MAARIGIDVGGSGARAATVDDNGLGVVFSRELLAKDAAAVTALVVELVVEVSQGRAPDAVGVAVPGFVAGGVVLGSPNLPDLAGHPLARAVGDALAARFGVRVPVGVENDANAAALGAWSLHDRPSDFLMLTLGTGVGGGIVSGGRLVTGAHGFAGEVGHIWVGGERPCGCGARGCLETWAGTAGMRWIAHLRGHAVRDGKEILDAARAGEAWAKQIVDEAGVALGRGVQTLLHTLDSGRVVIAGGLAAASDLLDPPMRRWLERQLIPPVRERLNLRWEGRADALAILGAAELVSR